MRHRTYTEMIGCAIPKHEYEILKAEMKRRRCTVADYLRQVAVRPLVEAQAADVEVQGHAVD